MTRKYICHGVPPSTNRKRSATPNQIALVPDILLWPERGGVIARKNNYTPSRFPTEVAKLFDHGGSQQNEKEAAATSSHLVHVQCEHSDVAPEPLAPSEGFLRRRLACGHESVQRKRTPPRRRAYVDQIIKDLRVVRTVFGRWRQMGQRGWN